jgi:hypothetical protein
MKRMIKPVLKAAGLLVVLPPALLAYRFFCYSEELAQPGILNLGVVSSIHRNPFHLAHLVNPRPGQRPPQFHNFRRFLILKQFDHLQALACVRHDRHATHAMWLATPPGLRAPSAASMSRTAMRWPTLTLLARTSAVN